MSTFDPAVQALLVANGAAISRRELLGVSGSASATARRGSSGELVPVVPGVYRSASTPLTPEIRLRATALRLGPAAVVAARSAAWWHGLTRITSDQCVVILPPQRGHERWSGLRVIRTRSDRADRTVVRGLAVTDRARTVLDCAGGPDAEDIRDAALQRGTSIWSLERALDRRGSGRGVRDARHLVLAAKAGGVSPPERLALPALLRAGRERWTAGLRARTPPAPRSWRWRRTSGTPDARADRDASRVEPRPVAGTAR